MDKKIPTFHCKAADIKINMPQCLMISQKELTFWGPDAAIYNKGCPCPKREEALMAKKNCKECGRPVYSGPICGPCRKEAKEKAEEGEKMDNAATVKMTREEDNRTQAAPDRQGKSRKAKVAPCVDCKKTAPIKGRGLCNNCYYHKVEIPNKEAKIAAKIMPVRALTTNIEKYSSLPPAVPLIERTDEQALITLAFRDDTDMKIYSFIESEARRCRRTPDQQALFMLQSHLPESSAAIYYKAHGDCREMNPGPL